MNHFRSEIPISRSILEIANTLRRFERLSHDEKLSFARSLCAKEFSKFDGFPEDFLLDFLYDINFEENKIFFVKGSVNLLRSFGFKFEHGCCILSGFAFVSVNIFKETVSKDVFEGVKNSLKIVNFLFDLSKEDFTDFRQFRKRENLAFSDRFNVSAKDTFWTHDHLDEKKSSGILKREHKVWLPVENEVVPQIGTGREVSRDVYWTKRDLFNPDLINNTIKKMKKYGLLYFSILAIIEERFCSEETELNTYFSKGRKVRGKLIYLENLTDPEDEFIKCLADLSCFFITFSEIPRSIEMEEEMCVIFRHDIFGNTITDNFSRGFAIYSSLKEKSAHVVFCMKNSI